MKGGQRQGNECKICGQLGHYAASCPQRTNRYNQYDDGGNSKKIHGVPEAIVKNIKVKDGIETIAPSQSEYQRLVKEGGLTTALSNIDMSKVPSQLKCAHTGKLLEDAVSLPCCNKIVSDGAIRAALLSSNLQCPLCSKKNVSPDELHLEENVRKAVEAFIVELSAGITDSEPIVVAPVASLRPTDPLSMPIQMPLQMPIVDHTLSMMQHMGGFGYPPMVDPFGMMFGMQGMRGMSLPGIPIGGFPPGIMPGPYPGLLIDSFSGKILPFDESLIPWELLPAAVFPAPVPYEVFVKEQSLQREHARKRGQKSSKLLKPTSPVPSARKTCPHGRTEGFCSDCIPALVDHRNKDKGIQQNKQQVRQKEKHQDRSKEKPKVIEQEREKDRVKDTSIEAPKPSKTCVHGRSEGYCKQCAPVVESIDNKSKDKESKLSTVKIVPKTCVHGRSEGYCKECVPKIEFKNDKRNNNDGASKGVKRERDISKPQKTLNSSNKKKSRPDSSNFREETKSQKIRYQEGEPPVVVITGRDVRDVIFKAKGSGSRRSYKR